MGVVNLRDAIILALLNDETMTQKDIASSLLLGTVHTRQSLSFLRESGLISQNRHHGAAIYRITDKGRQTLRAVYSQIAP